MLKFWTGFSYVFRNMNYDLDLGKENEFTKVSILGRKLLNLESINFRDHQF